MGISIRAYARHRGVTDTAVHKAIRAGRITPEADGTIDADRADREWARNSDALPAGASLQARTVNEVVKAQTNKVRLARLKGDWWIGRRPSRMFSSWRAPSAMRG
jgi:hypothetical protein